MKIELIDRLLRVRNKLKYGIYLLYAGLAEIGIALDELAQLMPSKPIRRSLRDCWHSEIDLDGYHLDDSTARILELFEDEKADQSGTN